MRRMAIQMLLLACIAASGPVRASNLDPLSLAFRAKVGEGRVLGDEQPQSFDEYGLAATLPLPWKGRSWSGWDVSARLLGSAGVLRGTSDSALVASVIPMIALVKRDLQLAVEIGAGLALLSKHDYGTQDYGGPLQLAVTFGLSVPVHRRIGIGYRFLHYSDAGAYGRNTIGADFHMLELIYYF